MYPVQRRVSHGLQGDDGPLSAERPHLHHFRHLKLPHEHWLQRAIRLHSGMHLLRS